MMSKTPIIEEVVVRQYYYIDNNKNLVSLGSVLNPLTNFPGEKSGSKIPECKGMVLCLLIFTYKIRNRTLFRLSRVTRVGRGNYQCERMNSALL